MNIALPASRQSVLWSMAITGALGLAWPGQAYATLRFVLANLWDVMPTIAIGIVLSAWVAASGAGAVSGRWFQGRPASTIVIASAIGSVTPVCGVTVLPLMTGFLAVGVPLAPIMAFWLSSPITDPAMFAVTWAVLGPAFAIGKAMAAFALGVFAGAGTVALKGTSAVEQPLRLSRGTVYRNCLPPGFLFQIWREPDRMQVFRAELLAMTKLIGLCLALAFSAEHLLRDLMPPDLLATYVGKESIYAIPLAVMVGAPMYLDGYAALPLVRGLLDAGMSPGAAMALLVSGGAVSIWGVLAVAAVLRPATIALFVAFATIGSLAIGYCFDAIWALLP